MTRVVVIGHSHIGCMSGAARSMPRDHAVRFEFLQLRDPALLRRTDVAGADFDSCAQPQLAARLRDIGEPDLTVLSIGGNQHIVYSLLDRGRTPEAVEQGIRASVDRRWFEFMRKHLQGRVAILPTPPPIASEQHIRDNPGAFASRLAEFRISPAALRLHAWQYQAGLLAGVARDLGLEYLEVPDALLCPQGFLAPAYYGADPTHANQRGGRVLLGYLADAAVAGPQPGAARRHPYQGLPDQAFWREAVAQVPAQALDPVAAVPFHLAPADRVATAGSCFAQHIARRIRASGFHFLVTEKPQDERDAQARGFEDFSARYGNVYTSRQLLQLFDRAYGYFTPVDDHWELPGGRVCDPFRPRIEPDGFVSVKSLREDRRRHLAAVRRMFERLDVFVFTLGLTECWMSRLDGAAYPVAPGVAGGRYDPARHGFVNLGVQEIVDDLRAFLGKLRLVNPRSRVILTVSPVPLAATREAEHVLVATTYSKSVLRVAAEIVERSEPQVFYFPSYEIITGAYARGAYFGSDLRSVTEDGVNHVMEVFMRRMTVQEGAPASVVPPRVPSGDDGEDREMEELAEVACDEALLAERG